MADAVRTIRTKTGEEYPIRIRRDRRLKKSARWVFEGGQVHLRIPYHLPERELGSLLDEVARKLDRYLRQRWGVRNDADLQERAAYINSAYFKGELEWQALRWVSNMRTRLGSCTNGGATDGHIRISDRIRDWPQWVIDYVIAHELLHRKYPNHSADFWEHLTQAYPLTERARGFIMGIGFAEKGSLEDGW